MAITVSVDFPFSESRDGLTADEFLKFCSEEEGDFELIRGEVFQLAPPGYDHGSIALNVGALLKPFARTHGLGNAVMETGFILDDNPSTVRSPDVAFIRKERLPEKDRGRGYFSGAPDFAVEVLSPSDTLKEAEDKIDMYFQAGTTLAWILDPDDATVWVYRPGEAPRQLGPEGEIDAEPLLPGFRCKISELFQ